MPDAAIRLPSTPAEVAAVILDKIEQYPKSFDMDSWFQCGPNDETALPPGAIPACGTTLCAAGWAAHVTGWTLKFDPLRPEVTARDEHGEYLTTSEVYAEKGSERRMIPTVAADALGLTPDRTTFWYAEPDVALERLRAIAGR